MIENTKPLTIDERYKAYEDAAKEVLVDFDGTLCQFSYPEMGPPIPGARRFLKALQARGLKAIIWSSRLSPQFNTVEERADSLHRISSWLSKHNMPHYSIDTGNSGKRLCLAYVDDRGVHANGNWRRVLKTIDHIRDNVESAHAERRERSSGSTSSA